jgi:hypothetical protein
MFHNIHGVAVFSTIRFYAQRKNQENAESEELKEALGK